MADDLEKISKAFSNIPKNNTTKKPNSTTKKTSTKNSATKSGTNKRTSNSSNGKHYWGKNYYKNPDLSSNTSNSKSKSNSSINKAIKSNANSVLNQSISSTISNNTNLSSSQANAINKQIKKLPLKSKICIVILFILGVAISIGLCFFICRNDQFEIVGKKNITLEVNDSYTDLGIKAIGFGVDMSSQVSIEVYKDGTKVDTLPNELDTSSDCIYQIVYNLSNFRFRDARIIRTIIVSTPEEVDPEDSYNPDNQEETSSINFFNSKVQNLINFN